MPEFSLKDQEGNLFHSVEHLGEKPLVIFFYPKDFTPGCTAEACAFRDHYEDFTDAGALVIGISSDSQASHRNFANRHRLPFILLSDPNKEVRRKFRVKNRLLNLFRGRPGFSAGVKRRPSRHGWPRSPGSSTPLIAPACCRDPSRPAPNPWPIPAPRPAGRRARQPSRHRTPRAESASVPQDCRRRHRCAVWFSVKGTG